MEIFYGCCLTILEMTFILVGLLILHGLRKVLGATPFYIAAGVLLIFTQFAGATGLRMLIGYQSLDFPLSSSVLSLPFLAILVVVYVTDGTLSAQRLIIGVMAALGFYVYLASITQVQTTWPGYTIGQGVAAESLGFLLSASLRLMAATVISLTFDLFLLPIFFQRLTNLRCRLYVTVTGSLLLIQLIDHIVFVTIAYWGTPEWWSHITASYFARAIFVVILSIPTTIYLSRISHENPGESRRTLDIILAFFGGYGRALKLEQNLRESQERYRMLVQNASDMIIVMNETGWVLDANRAALKMLGADTFSEVINHSFEEVAGLNPEVWLHLLEHRTDSGYPKASESSSVSCSIIVPEKGTEIDLSITMIPFENAPLLITFGRDVTERRKLEREREEWHSQLSHRQRLEAIGRLAGGIAHDFNNYIHAIQGHLDIIKYMHEVQDEDIRRNLDKIHHITELAGTLTSQMLSFARKGNYQNVDVDIRMLVDKCAELFLPGTQSGITFRIIDDGRKYIVRGDAIQLQQTLLNLMINAKDAMQSNPDSEEQILTIRIGEPHAMGIELDPPPEVKLDSRRKLCAIRVEDTGTGIDPAVKARVFEPFFTTKPVGKGTGMGLAMAYGTILAHNGWLQCCNLPGRGAAFDIILPIEQQISENNGGESL